MWGDIFSRSKINVLNDSRLSRVSLVWVYITHRMKRFKTGRQNASPFRRAVESMLSEPMGYWIAYWASNRGSLGRFSVWAKTAFCNTFIGFG